MKRHFAMLIIPVFLIALLAKLTGTDAAAISIRSTFAAPSPLPAIDPLIGSSIDVESAAFSDISIRGTEVHTGPIKYVGNPVLDVGPGTWDSGGVGQPTVLFKENKYEMYYSGNSLVSTTINIGRATSDDGITWAKDGTNPVLTVGPPGSWDSAIVNSPRVTVKDGEYKMWYLGSNDPISFAGASIGLATSTDGKNWVKHSGNPVLSPGAPGSWDDSHLFSRSVVVVGNTYKMWYSAYDGNNYRIGYATSMDGVAWKKFSGNPVLNVGTSGSWDSQNVYYPNVIVRGGSYEMYYSGSDGSSSTIGRATSTDGTNWMRDSKNPVLKSGSAGSWDSDGVFGSPIVAQKDFLQMWYTGTDEAGVDRIGTATSEIPISLKDNLYVPLIFS